MPRSEKKVTEYKTFDRTFIEGQLTRIAEVYTHDSAGGMAEVLENC